MPHADPEVRREYYRKWKQKNAAKMKEYARAYNAEHRDRIRQLNREWKAKHPDVIKESSRADYRKHREKRVAKHKEYVENHRDELRRYYAEYRRISPKVKEWRDNNRERINAKHREYRRNSNPKFAAWRAANRDKLRAAEKEFRKSDTYKRWCEKNRDKLREYKRKRYWNARDVLSEFQHEYHVRVRRRSAIYLKWEKCGHLCYICGNEVLIDDIHIDHVFPVARGGDNDIKNLMPTHGSCNNKKKDKLEYPCARPDLIELTSDIEAAPRKPKRAYKWKA